MQTNTNIDLVAIDIQVDRADKALPTLKYTRRSQVLPFALFFTMVSAIFLLDAVLPLQGLWFHNVLLTQVGPWFQWPTSLLFPGWDVTAPLPYANPDYNPPVALGWAQIPFLLTAFVAVFLVYLLAIRRLPRQITYRYILVSTVIFGIMYMLIPVATSPDLFSYIGYARMGIIYHLNPLTTLPIAISNDPSFIHIYWTNQPSAYGPTWAFISSILQLVTLPFGKQALLPMVIALRLLGLAMHLCSTALIWSISGYLQRIDGRISLRRRKLATLAFAWNPLLLFEACTNAHNDATLLVFILLALWFLVRAAQNGDIHRGLAPAMIMLALATCLKINIVLLVPGLLLLLWNQQPRHLRSIISAGLLYGGIILLLYAPFWQNGSLLSVVRDNPTAYRNINSLPEFVSELFNGITGLFGFTSSFVENLTHLLSQGIFVVIYVWLCWRATGQPANKLQTLSGLVRWMALIWLLYCAIGTPWFWPWYLVTFFGLYALVESVPSQEKLFSGLPGIRHIPGMLRIPLAIRLLGFSMLSIYCFYVWGVHSSYVPGLSGFSWSFLRGLWVWAIPLLAFCPYLYRKIAQRYHMQRVTSSE